MTQYPKQLAIIGRERAMIDSLTKKLHNTARQVGDYTKIRDTRRGNTFEVRLGDGRIAKITIELDRVEEIPMVVNDEGDHPPEVQRELDMGNIGIPEGVTPVRCPHGVNVWFGHECGECG